MEWIFDKNAKQRLYLSSDTTRMLEVINERLGILYERDNRNFVTGQLVQWQFKAMIPNFPYLAFTVTSYPTMFSPNFEHMFDINFDKKCLRVIKTEDQSVLLEVPKDFISMNEQDDDVDSVR